MRLKVKAPVESQMTIGSVTKFSASIVFGYVDVIFQWFVLFAVFCIASLGAFFAFIMHKKGNSFFGFEVYANRALEHLSTGELSLLIIGGGLFLVGSIILGLYTYGLFTRASFDKLEGVKRGVVERTKLAFKEGFRLFPFFILIFIANLIVQTPYLVAMSVWDETHVGAQVLIYLACVAAQLFLFAKLATTVPSIIKDKMPTIKAVKQSWNLTRGNVLRIFGYKIVNGLVSMAYMIPFMIIMTIIIVALSFIVGIGSYTSNFSTFVPALSIALFIGFDLYIFMIGIVYIITYSCDVAIYEGLLREKQAMEAPVQTEEEAKSGSEEREYGEDRSYNKEE